MRSIGVTLALVGSSPPASPCLSPQIHGDAARAGVYVDPGHGPTTYGDELTLLRA